MDGDDRVCFVVPARNQAGYLRPHYCAVARRMQGLGRDWEIVFVDDGSDDDSPAVLRALAAEDRRVRAVRMSRPVGLEAAVAAGLARCDGAASVVVDAAIAPEGGKRRSDGVKSSSATAYLAAPGFVAAIAWLLAWLLAWLAVWLAGSFLPAAQWTFTAAVFATVALVGMQLLGLGLTMRRSRRAREDVPAEPRYVAVESIGFDRRRVDVESEPAILRFSAASRRRPAIRVLRERVLT